MRICTYLHTFVYVSLSISLMISQKRVGVEGLRGGASGSRAPGDAGAAPGYHVEVPDRERSCGDRWEEEKKRDERLERG